MKFRTLAKALVPLLILAIGIGGFAYLRATKPKPPKPRPQEKSWRVETMPAAPAARTPTLTLHGSVEATTRLTAAAPGASWVAELPVREGQRVEAGTLLVALDPRDFSPRVTQARSELAELQAQLELERQRGAEDREALKTETELLELARVRAERAERLKQQNLGATTALEDARAALARQQLALGARRLAVDGLPARLRQLEARLERLRDALAQAELAFERSRISAPYDGVVARVSVNAGDRVQPGQPLLEIYATAGLELRTRIPARHVAEIGAMADAGATARAVTASGVLPLRLSRLAGTADPSGVDALFGFGAGVPLMRPGTLLQIDLDRPQQGVAYAVPSRAVYGDTRLYLLRDERLHGIDITVLGELRGDDGEALLLVRGDEIGAGDEVVTTHLPNAVSGLKVERVAP